MRSKALISFGVLACVSALGAACGSKGDDDTGSDTGSGGASMPSGSGGVASGSGGSGMTSGSGGKAGTGSGGSGSSGSGGKAGTGSGGSGSQDASVGPVEADCSKAGPPKEGMCKENRNGIFAIKTEVDVWWQDEAAIKGGYPPIVDPGRNKITVTLLGRLEGVCEDGSNGVGIMKGCGTTLPPFTSDAACDAFQITFPDELWDQPEMPTFTTGGMSSGFNPGDLLSIATATGLIGIELTDEAGVWPIPSDDGSGAPTTGTLTCPSGMGEKCFPDHDGDKRPGVTVKMGRIGENYTEAGMCNELAPQPFVFRGAPTDPINGILDDSVRAVTMQIGLRTRLGGEGAIGADCKSGSGAATVENLDSRVYSCQLDDGMDCSSVQGAVEFIDNSSPIYHILKKGEMPPSTVMKPNGDPLDQTPSTGAHSALVRLGGLDQDFSCGDARDAMYPAFTN